MMVATWDAPMYVVHIMCRATLLSFHGRSKGHGILEHIHSECLTWPRRINAKEISVSHDIYYSKKRKYFKYICLKVMSLHRGKFVKVRKAHVLLEDLLVILLVI